MILYYFPIAQNTVNKIVSDFFQRCKCLFMNVHIFYYFSIYWSDTSLGVIFHDCSLQKLCFAAFLLLFFSPKKYIDLNGNAIM